MDIRYVLWMLLAHLFTFLFYLSGAKRLAAVIAHQQCAQNWGCDHSSDAGPRQHNVNQIWRRSIGVYRFTLYDFTFSSYFWLFLATPPPCKEYPMRLRFRVATCKPHRARLVKNVWTKGCFLRRHAHFFFYPFANNIKVRPCGSFQNRLESSTCRRFGDAPLASYGADECFPFRPTLAIAASGFNVKDFCGDISGSSMNCSGVALDTAGACIA
jgi:hypothetical protein